MRIQAMMRHCAAVLIASFGVGSSAAGLTATPTVIPTPSPTPFVCDGVEYPQPVLEFDFSVDPPHPIVGDALTVSVTVTNVTGGFVGRPVISLSSSAPIFSAGSMNGGSFHWTPVHFELLAGQPGTTDLRAIITYEAKTGCCGYCYTPGAVTSPPFTLFVGGGEPLPDLVPSEIIVEPVDVPACVIDVASYVESNPIPTGVCVRNIGGAAAGPFVVAKDDMTTTVDGLRAGESVCVAGFFHPADMPNALVRVDTEQDVVERNEDNNDQSLHVPLPSLPSVCGTPTHTPIPSPASDPVCAGDCDASGQVRVDELVRSVHIALVGESVETCQAIDADHDGKAAVNELVGAVNAALRGCGRSASPSPSLTPTRYGCDDPTARDRLATCKKSTTQQQCEHAGGSWGTYPYSGRKGCFCPTGEGGCPCDSSSDCADRCYSPLTEDRCATVVSGVCSGGEPEGGCRCQFGETEGYSYPFCNDP